MNRVAEIKQRMQHLVELSARMKQQLDKLKGAEGIEMRKKAKEAGTRLGIGAGISAFGLTIIAVASVYIIAVVILLVNIALDRMWLSALIVVAGFLLIGAAVAVIGVTMARKAAKDIPKIGSEVVQELKDASEEMKKTVEEVQAIAKQEADQRQEQMKEMMGQAMKVAPIVIGAYVGYRLVKKVVRNRRTRSRIIREEFEEE